jgi:hypothetical protein
VLADGICLEICSGFVEAVGALYKLLEVFAATGADNAKSARTGVGAS